MKKGPYKKNKKLNGKRKVSKENKTEQNAKLNLQNEVLVLSKSS